MSLFTIRDVVDAAARESTRASMASTRCHVASTPSTWPRVDAVSPRCRRFDLQVPRRRRRDPERTDTQVQNVVKILGLRFGTKYTQENIKTLRYGHLMIMTDQDHDGRCLGVVSRDSA